MEEIWKDIVGYEGLYMVSNKGNVLSLPKKMNNGGYLKARILKNEINNGYCRVLLCKDKKHRHHRIHLLVAEAFQLDKNNYKRVNEYDIVSDKELIINHIDENKSNNNVDNLEWCTPKYNINYGECKKKIARALGKKVIQKKNGEIVNIFESISDCARKNDIDISPISLCCNKKIKQAYGYEWEFVDTIG